MAVERTFSIVKPDGVQKNVIGEVYRRWSSRLASRSLLAKMVAAAPAGPGRGFLRGCTKSVRSSRNLGQVHDFRPGDAAGAGRVKTAVAKNRELDGAPTDPKKADKGIDFRADLANSIDENTVHGSDSLRQRENRDHAPLLLGHRNLPAHPQSDLICRLRALMNATTAKTNLLGLHGPSWEAFVANMGEKPFRARQLMKWLYKRHLPT